MALTRWNLFKGLVNVPQDADRLFEEFFGLFPVELNGGSGTWSPAVDVSEDQDNIYFTVEVPGMSKEDVKVTLQDNVLTIRGEKKQEMEKKDANYHRLERSYGSFTRSFSLPTGVVPDKIKAQYQDGLLKISLPKAEQVKPKEIPIAMEGK
ncbi:MAG: hypothetical protein RBG1_1C00001G1442 [candidate division Zixibacteria bacterium RBG-1]|nr:MAG: hypothetical protein RBG1_1C00001G1442 [candidate division Zixibacteria bacterium RBG-1]OGC85196.1 MAG: hypothetical protein A2V73_01170 [candidate division Zixibacteria bacterium RBG_19FT_COMBO_42_43]